MGRRWERKARGEDAWTGRQEKGYEIEDERVY